jgi:hypothetical protein
MRNVDLFSREFAQIFECGDIFAHTDGPARGDEDFKGSCRCTRFSAFEARSQLFSILIWSYPVG